MNNLTKSELSVIAQESESFRKILVDNYAESIACSSANRPADVVRLEQELGLYLRCFREPWNIKISLIKLVREFANRNGLSYLIPLKEAKEFVEKWIVDQRFTS